MRDVSDIRDKPENPPEVSDRRRLSREAEKEIMGRDLSKAEKGEIGERAMVMDHERQGRQVLLQHADNPNERGFDDVTWDPKERQLYIGEAKNYRDSPTVTDQNLSALSEHRLDANKAEAWEAIRSSDLSKGEKISAQSQLRHHKFTTELYVPRDVQVAPSARQRLAEVSGNWRIKQYDGRDLWSQERKVIGRQLS